MSDIDTDVRAYARLAAALSHPDADRSRRLSEHGLDETQWEQIEERWLERLSEADAEDEAAVPSLVRAHAEAFAEAQRDVAGALIDFDRYVQITRAMQQGTDLTQVLERFDLDLATYLHAHQHWTARLAVDGALAERFRKALLGH